LNTYQQGVYPFRIALTMQDGSQVELDGNVIGPPYAAMTRDGGVQCIQVWLEEQEGS
jgi:hypothetical protein